MLGHKSEPQDEMWKSFRMLQQFYRSFMGTNCLHYAAGSSFQVCLTDSHKMSTGSRCFSYYHPLCFYAFFFFFKENGIFMLILHMYISSSSMNP